MRFGKRYFWVLGYSPSGKRALVGPYTSEVLANQAAEELDDSEVFVLGTKNQQKAVKEIKAKIFQQEGDMDAALEKQLHNRGVQREGVRIPSPTKLLAEGGDDIFKGDPFRD